MYIRKTTKTYQGKTYHNYLLVESVHTPKGPRQRTICSLGSLSPGPAEQWHGLALKVKDSLEGQLSLEAATPQVDTLVEKVQRGARARLTGSDRLLRVDTDGVRTEQSREAGPVHVGHQLWRQLGLDKILKRAGLSDRSCRLSESMTLNRLIFPLSELAMPDWIRRTAMGEIL